MNRYGSLLASVIGILGPLGCIPDGAPANGGTAAAVSATDAKRCGPDGMLDDAEDENNQIALNKGRSGYWYTFGDKAGSTIAPAAGGTFAMSPGGANGSKFAAHISGKVGTGDVVYVGMGFNFVDPKGPHDLSAYKGISFWAKSNSPTRVRVKLPDGNTDPEGKVCTACFNDFGMDLELTPTWTKYTIPFGSASQLAGWGAPHPASVERTKMYGVQWQVNTPGAAYDVWVDDIELTGCP
ncbi:Hypothetical protein A7982_03339 [Minicystis rosea]|nr:Hypothetical protein A7982_03339 [Minicystis rosea]